MFPEFIHHTPTAAAQMSLADARQKHDGESQTKVPGENHGLHPRHSAQQGQLIIGSWCSGRLLQIGVTGHPPAKQAFLLYALVSCTSGWLRVGTWSDGDMVGWGHGRILSHSIDCVSLVGSKQFHHSTSRKDLYFSESRSYRVALFLPLMARAACVVDSWCVPRALGCWLFPNRRRPSPGIHLLACSSCLSDLTFEQKPCAKLGN
ncbi:hypothetical protein METBIDRAFT_116074 [Metschnikowia bicuspidata var. bicuspidata NRRL YB-4993]|uniref:Uncharacterized protein n=1 Tax=Metschnikowia bicuspidata var. bicuspidata NRRL YB-4993 TaxID=869754 RepID=A0A1A0HJ28_9ASCO|nr:hypothetical protein METBIDRAFT_116074 [Metschnikowia bicuspidata var. bicuspidata NRRL YB-4993]OBA24006.1 hypothetical protein METBIDRAFT_116074 [Metschnikowia bicuspidata var. bicuspidata NRRL YB-4993]